MTTVLLPGVKNRMDMPNRRLMDGVAESGGSVETCSRCAGLYREGGALLGAAPVCHGCRTHADAVVAAAEA